jgi:hypothetical protein
MKTFEIRKLEFKVWWLRTKIKFIDFLLGEK